MLIALLWALGAQMAAADTLPILGPSYPPPGGVTFSAVGGDGAIARLGGETWNYSNVALAATNPVWWGPTGNEIKISFDGGSYSGQEIQSYQPGQSDLANGKAVWTGQTNILGIPIYTRFTLTAKNGDGTALPLADAAQLGLPASVGALVPVANGQSFSANLYFEASSSQSGPFQPAYNLFDSYHSTYNLGYSAYSSFSAGFYYQNAVPVVSGAADLVIDKNGSASYAFTVSDSESDASQLTVSATSQNETLIPSASLVLGGSGTERTLAVTPAAGLTGTAQLVISISDGTSTTQKTVNVLVNSPPRLLANNQLIVDRGAAATLTTSNLSASDAESSSAQLTYTLASGGDSGGPPHEGTLLLSGKALGAGATFTQQDVDNGLLQYLHGGACSQNDDFQFSVRDGQGASIPTGLYSSYSFHIGVNQPNRAPVAQNSSASVPMGRAIQGTLPAVNDDCTPQTLTFRILSNPAKGTVALTDPNTGAFSYTPNDGATGADSFTFQVNDGIVDAAAAGTVTLSIVNHAPVASAGSAITSENGALNGTLSATDSDLPPQPLTFAIVANGSKGTAVITDPGTGAFTYTPNGDQFGSDSFSFTASDGELTSAPAQYTVHIRPTLQKGRIVVTNGQSNSGKASVVLIDPVTKQQGIFSYGDQLSNPRGIAFEANGNMVVADGDSGLIRIDRSTGAQSTLVGPGVFTMPIGIAVERSGSILVGTQGGLYRVNPVTGNFDYTFSGDQLDFPAGVKVAANGDLVVTDVGAFAQKPSQVLRVDAVTGSQSVISEGGNLSVPSDLALGDDGAIYLSDGPIGTSNILKIGPADGSQSVVTSGGSISQPSGLILLNGKLIVTSAANSSVISVDPADGSQEILASGDAIANPFGIAAVVVDETAPATSATPGSGVYSVAQNVSLTCNDGAGSGCAGTYYCLGSGCTPETPYAGSIALAGSQVLRFFSKDGADNSEAVQEARYDIVSVPVIVGMPPSTVTAGTSYSFTPTASNANGFSILNQPIWASFDAASGTLSGTPKNADVGTYANITISANNPGGSSALEPFTIVVTPPLPTGSITIDEGTSATASIGVTLALQATSSYAAVSAMQFSNDNLTWSDWEPYAGSKSYLLPAGDGLKTVYVRFKDSAGSVSGSYASGITLDTTPPALQLSALQQGAMTDVAIMNVTGLVRDPSGVRSLSINGSAVAVAPDGSFNEVLRLAPGRNSVTFAASDLLGNSISLPQSVTLNEAAPVLTVSAPADNSSTAAPFTEVTGAIDAGSVVQISNNGGTPQLAAVTGREFSATVNLSEGLNTIMVSATDLNGKTSTVKRSVVFDSLKPSLAIVTPAQDLAVAQGSFEIQGVVADAVLPVQVTVEDGEHSYSPELVDGSFRQQLTLTDEKIYTIKVTVTDAVGATTTVTRNLVHMLGRITINNGNRATKSTGVAVSLDYPGAAMMQFSTNGSTWGSWLPFARTANTVIPSGDGLKTLYVRFKDGKGAISRGYSDSIVLDNGVPGNGTLTITPAPGVNALSWKGFSDSASGIASYRLVGGSASYPACTAPALYTGTAGSFVHNGIVAGTTYYYRLCAVDAVGNTSTGATATIKARAEYDAPVGSVSINGGATYTNSANVTLSLAATDASGVAQVCISNTATCSAWVSFAPTKSWSLTSGSGLKTVNVWFKDVLGNVNSAPRSASIILDVTAPNNGTVSIAPVPGSFTLSWQGFSDSVSGVAGYKLVAGTASAPACTAAALYAGKETSYVHTGLSTGTTYYYRVCAIDTAGNISSGATAARKALSEYDAPAGAVTINGGAAYTKSASVSLALPATDATGVAQICISNSATCSTWSPYAATKSWSLSSGDGAKTVSVWFKDSLGNANSKPYTASITLDSTAPVNGSVGITPQPGSFTLNWKGFADSLSGIAGYKVVAGTTAAPACTAPALYQGSDTSYVHSGLSTGTTYYYRVCAVDAAGNVSSGSLVSRKALAEYDAPTGGVLLNGGASYTKSATVTLGLPATDANGPAKVCISNTATCSNWSSYSASKSWTLTSGNGLKTVNVWYMDALGNSNQAPYSASITLDATPPVNGTLTITPGSHQATVSWRGFADAQSGIAGYRLVVGSSTYPACNGTPLYSGSETSFIHDGLSTGSTYYYRVCAIDNAGNASAGATALLKAP